MAVESRITKGAPYSAETTTESLQVLGDGNRISRKTVTRVFRDAEGRTRVENFNAAGEVTTVNISDPVAGESYVLNPAKRTAVKSGTVMVAPAGAGGRGGGGGTRILAPASGGGGDAAEMERRRQVELAATLNAAAASVAGARGGGGFGSADGARGGGGGRGGVGAGPVNREDLGQQVIEGVMSTGTRSTTVIPAGTIGNEREIKVVSEQWLSDDLKVLVLTKHSDPRVGDTTFKLTNISRSDPAAALFTVPTDYTMETSAIRRDR
jgi:hypothetical protein